MSFAIPNSIHRLLQLPSETGAEAVGRITCVWPWAPWATLLLVAFAIVFVVAIYRLEGRRAPRSLRIALAAVRLATIALTLLLIAQVTLTLQRVEMPETVVLLDDSRSMTIVDQYPESARKTMAPHLPTADKTATDWSRWNLLQSLLASHDGRLLHRIAKTHKLHLRKLSDPATDLAPDTANRDRPDFLGQLRSLEPKAESTRLARAVHAALDTADGTPPAAVVLLTDGITTEGPPLAEAAEYARRRGVPLFFVGLGSERPLQRAQLSDLMVDDVVFVNDRVTFECRLSCDGLNGQKVRVVLRERNKSVILATTEVIAGSASQSQSVRLTYSPSQVGRFDYIVETQPLEGEPVIERNSLTRTIEVRKEQIRVLLVQAYPNFEFRYLRNMLARDDTISLHSVLQEADPEVSRQDPSMLPTFPAQREELFAYDAIILGDVNPALLTTAALQNLADFVTQPGKGGAMILIAGPSYMPSAYLGTPLARLLPFTLDNLAKSPTPESLDQPFILQPTDLGLTAPGMQLADNAEQNAAVWRSLAPLYWLLELPELKPGVRVLAGHPSRLGSDGRHLPVFCFQYLGSGKVLFHATDETWRWRYRIGDEYFARYWIQTIRYLCRSKLVETNRTAKLTTDRRDYRSGDPVRLRAQFFREQLAPAEDNGATVVVDLPGQTTQRIPLTRKPLEHGIFEGEIPQLIPGTYHAWIAVPTFDGPPPAVNFTVAPPTDEFSIVQTATSEMTRAAEHATGRYYTFETAHSLPEDLPTGQATAIQSLPPRPLWNRWPVLAAFIALLTTEWVLRRHHGLT